MANYEIPQYPTKRLRYFHNQFLREQDFIDDSSYQIAHERAFLRTLYIAGVCEGMAVSYPAASSPPSVGAGIAIDKNGHMIVLDQPTNGLTTPGSLADGEYYVYISFRETADDRATGPGAPDYTRWTQAPVINVTAKAAALPDGAVVLGSCTVNNGAFVGQGTTSGRQYSGLRLPGPNQDVAATLRGSAAGDGLALLTGSLTIRRDVSGGLGPTLTLLNGGSGSGAGGAIDFNGHDPGTNDPSLRIQSLDDDNGSSHLAVFTKAPGSAANTLVERLRITSDGSLQLSNNSPNDKLVLYDGGATGRYGIGLNTSNINLFYPTDGRFSLRQNSSTGNEVFRVNANGAVTFSGPIVPKVGNGGSSGIYFSTNPGSDGYDEAFLRYYAADGENTKLVLGINNDPEDELVLWQNNAARLTIANKCVSIGTDVSVTGNLNVTGSITGKLTVTGRITGDLAVEGNLTASRAKFGAIGIGPGGDIRLDSNNLRVYFGEEQRMALRGDGKFSINFDRGVWVFFEDGSVLQYYSDHSATYLWQPAGA